ncbi:MAG: alpha-N-arabinofuranosidase, partial [Promethearchaeota archaeon]
MHRISDITIRADRPTHLINKNIYGHFAEHLGECIYGGIWVGPDSEIKNIDGMRKDVIDALKKIKVPILRWPGGCFADDYHWMDGIGPRWKRPIRKNRWWGGIETNEFGTHEFLEFCRLIGCEPYICGNVGSGSVKEMSDWVEYLNCKEDTTLTRLRAQNGHPQPYNVHYWGIGNENWGCGGNMSAYYYANEYRRYSTYLEMHCSEPLYKIASGANSFDYRWTENFFTTISGKKDHCGSRLSDVQGYAFHYYYSANSKRATGYDEKEWFLMILKVYAMEELIIEHRRIIDRFDPGRRVGLICDEWGTWYEPMAGTNPKWLKQQNTIRDAVVAALTLDLFNKNADKIAMANIAQLVNVLQAMILTDGPKMIKTPTYYVYKLYSSHQDAIGLDLEIKTRDISFLQIPAISGSCSEKNGVITLSLVNTNPTDFESVHLNFQGCDVKPIVWHS